MGETGKRILTALACIIMGCALSTVLLYGTFARGGGRQTAAADDVAKGQEKYAEIIGVAEEYFIGDSVDMDQVNDAMAAGVVAGLGDRWSYYVSAEDYQSYQDGKMNAYVGVGITVQANIDEVTGNQHGLLVQDVSSGGSALEQGVQVGDILVAVDGNDVTESAVTEVKQMVAGEAGTQVLLTFERKGKTVSVTCTRKALTVIPASGELLDGGVGYIRIENFDGGCADAVIALVEDLRARGAKSLLFDVRNNPGGLKTELIALLDYLLPEGVIFHSVNYQGTESIAQSDAGCVDMPMAVLVNFKSYSASEYFACALQEYGAGIVVGEQTYGKGYYQIGIPLKDGSAVNLSVGKYYTPQGKSLIDVGVTPDIAVSLDEGQDLLLASKKLEHDEDPQLRAAVDALSAQSDTTE